MPRVYTTEQLIIQHNRVKKFLFSCLDCCEEWEDINDLTAASFVYIDCESKSVKLTDIILKESK